MLTSMLPKENLNSQHSKHLTCLSKSQSPDIDIDADVNVPDLNLSAPEVGTSDLDVSLPKAGVDVNVPTADVDINAPKGKQNSQHSKVNLSSPKVKSPDVDIAADVNGPDLNLSAPEVDTPDLDVSLPKAGVDIDVPTADVDINAPKGKFKFPTLKTFNLSGPKVKSPDIDIDADVNGPDLNLSAPEVGTPDLDASLPKAGVDVNVPTADVDINAPKGKLKFPTLKKFNLSSPKVKSPDVDIAADVSGPDLNLSAPRVGSPDVDVSLPNAGYVEHLPNVDVPGINTEVEGSKRKVKWPFKRRKSTELKDVDINIKAPEVDGTTAEIKLPKNIPLYKPHPLPGSNIDSILQELTGAVDLSTDPTKTINDAVVSVSSVKTNLKASSPSVGVNGQTATVDIRERLRLSNAHTTKPRFWHIFRTSQPYKSEQRNI